MMKSNHCIAKLARALEEKLPDTLQTFLIESSFDTETFILGIDILEHTEYDYVEKSEAHFEFKPGHRSLLKLLPKSLKDYNSKQQNERPKSDLQNEKQLTNKN